MAFETNFKPARKTAAERQAERHARRQRHGWRKAAKVNKFGEPTKAAEIAKAKAHENEVRADSRRRVWLRSEVCEYLCGLTEKETAEVCWKATHEADEVLPRSATRGLPPEVRFAVENTARACACCHQMKTDHKFGVVFHDEQLGMNGDYELVGRQGEILKTVRR